MPVAVAMQQHREKKDPLDTIAKGLGVAQGVFGLKEAFDSMGDKSRARELAVRENDPNSPESIALRQTVKESFGKDLPPSTSFAQAKKMDILSMMKMGAEFKKTGADISKSEADTEQTKFKTANVMPLEIEKTKADILKTGAETKKINSELLGPGGGDLNKRLAKLPTESRQRLDNSRMGLQAVIGMGKALEGGQNTFSLVGDNDFTQQRALFEEALGRMQSGGAIGKGEEARFKAMAPKLTDTPEMRQKKITELQQEMITRMQTLGFKPEEFGIQAAQFNLPKDQGLVERMAGFFGGAKSNAAAEAITPEMARAELDRRRKAKGQ